MHVQNGLPSTGEEGKNKDTPHPMKSRNLGSIRLMLVTSYFLIIPPMECPGLMIIRIIKSRVA